MNLRLFLFKIISLLILLFSFLQNENNFTTDPKIVRISNFLDSLNGFSGAVLIAKNDSVLLKKAYGFANIGHSVKNNTDTKFSYASVGKSFTAVAIFQLIQQGKLALNDPVGKFLPEYPNKIVRDSITIELLLTHRSGLPNYFHSPKFLNTSKEHFRGLDSLSVLYENEPLESKPNQQFEYRNTNYILLGRIIQAVSKMTYDDYVEKYIFSVLGMKNTGNFDTDHVIENVAENYTLSEIYPNKLQKATFKSAVKSSSAGGGFSTLDDLYAFAKAFEKNRLLKPTYTNIMKKIPAIGTYGYGMQFSGGKESGIYGHSGGHFGVGVEWRVFSKQNYTVIILTNKDADQGFLDARFFIEQTIAGSTAKLDNYFFTKKLVQVCLDKGIEEAKDLKEYSKSKISEIDLNAKGYELIKRGFYKKAIEIFKLEVISFPKSFDAYDSLGEAYMKDGQINKAIKAYKMSLELNNESRNAQEKLQILIKH